MIAIPKVSSFWDLLVPIVKEFEGFRAHAYWDKDGRVWTIGYGTTVYPTGKKVKKGDLVTRSQALEYMSHDLQTKRLPAIAKYVKVELSPGQIAALASFSYNVGTYALGKSTLVKRLNAGEPKDAVAKEFKKWNKAKGKVLAGLTRRRKAEADLFLS